MGEGKLYQSIEQELTRYLTLNKKRRTPERYAILNMIYTLPYHFDIDVLYQKMTESDFIVSRATLYNTLNLLIDAQLVRKHVFGNTPTQYERLQSALNHHHLICVQCGAVLEAKDTDLQELLGKRKFKKFTLHYYNLYLYGLCAKCSAANKKRKKKLSNNK